MYIIKRSAALLLALALLFCLGACEKNDGSDYKVLESLDRGEYSIAFRAGDKLRDFVSAALSELAAAGELSRLSSRWLGADYSSLEGDANALQQLGEPIPADRLLLVGVESGAAPMCSAEGGSFVGFVPAAAELVCEKLGWRLRFIPISADVRVELNSGNVDCAWIRASFSAGDESLSLSPGYMKNERLLVVRRDSGIRRRSGLSGGQIAVTGNTGSLEALKAAGLPGSGGAVWTYDSVQACFDALRSGSCDALVVDQTLLSYYLR